MLKFVETKFGRKFQQSENKLIQETYGFHIYSNTLRGII